jgi:hypothetical protein
MVLAAALVRVAAALERATPSYFPDEVLYGQLARSIAETGRPGVVGGPAGLMTLLQPLATAWTWLPGDPELAYRLTQCMHAVVMALGAIPVFLLARHLRLTSRTSLLLAALTLASPELLYSGYVTADAIGFTLALWAVYAGVRMLALPSLGSQALFLAASGLATFARLQYVVFLPAAAVASILVERGSLRSAARQVPLVVALAFAGCLAVVAAPAVLGRYTAVTEFRVSGGFAHWAWTTTVLLGLAAGVAVFPGAVAGTVAQIVRPTSTARLAYSALVGPLVITLVLLSALVSDETGSERFFERYLVVAIPITAVAFTLWIDDGRPLVPLALAGAAAGAGFALFVPISTYTAGQGRADSPMLLAVGFLEEELDVGTASLVVSWAILIGAIVALASCVLRRATGAIALIFTLLVFVGESTGAHVAANESSARFLADALPGETDWVDAQAGDDVVLLHTGESSQSASLAQLVWNRRITRIAGLGKSASPILGSSGRVAIAPDGTLELDGSPLVQPLLVATGGSRPWFADAKALHENGAFALVEPTSRMRLSALVEGLGADGWLAPSARATVYACHELDLIFRLPRGVDPVRLRLTGSWKPRTVTVGLGRPARARVAAPRGAARTLEINALNIHFRDGLRAVSVVAEPALRSSCSRGPSG